MLTWGENGDEEESQRKTDIGEALEFLTRVMRRRCTCFVLSDFFDRKDFLKPLQIANRKHDVVAVQIYDALCRQLPDVGLLKVRDAETGHEMYIDTSDRKLRAAHRNYFLNRQQQLSSTFSKSQVDWISIATDEDYVKQLILLFKQRS